MLSRNVAWGDFLVGILIFKELTARRLYNSFVVKGLSKRSLAADAIRMILGLGNPINTLIFPRL
jgi:hypothetical protein